MINRNPSKQVRTGYESSELNFDREWQIISEEVERRKINHLIHFTRLENVESILKYGLLSRDQLENMNLKYIYNDESRTDKVTNAICISIEFPNYRMFYKKREREQTKWVIISITSSVLYRQECVFCTTNASSSSESTKTQNERKTSRAFKLLFQDNVNKSTRVDMKLPDKHPTDPQAEVLVLNKIEKSNILEIIFRTEEDRIICLSNMEDCYKENVKFVVDEPSRFWNPRPDWQNWSK